MNCGMSLLNIVLPVVLLVLAQQVICFVPQSPSPANLPSFPQNDVTLPLQNSLADDTGRVVYDPGDASTVDVPNAYYEDYNDLSTDIDINAQLDLLRKIEDDMREEQEIVSKSALLMKLLEDPNIGTMPLVYVEDSETIPDLESVFPSLAKRSRYYRRYPWKRQNSRYRTSRNNSSYDADARYLCVPSREDVFKLLVGLHENRKGNHLKTVTFCNRKRPAKAILTNIRFLG